MSIHPPSVQIWQRVHSKKSMRNFTTWGTEVEIIAFAQLTGYDVLVYTQHKEFATY